MLFHSPTVPGLPQCKGAGILAAAYKHDPPMPQTVQVLYRISGAAGAVGFHIAAIRAVVIADVNAGGVCQQLSVPQLGSRGIGYQQKAVYPLREHPVHSFQLQLRVVLGIDQENTEALFGSKRLNDGKERGKIRVAYIRHDYADGTALLSGQTLGGEIRDVPQPQAGILYSLPGLLADEGVSLQSAGDSRRADAGLSGHIPNCYPFHMYHSDARLP